jgi:hypothetical protein
MREKDRYLLRRRKTGAANFAATTETHSPDVPELKQNVKSLVNYKLILYLFAVNHYNKSMTNYTPPNTNPTIQRLIGRVESLNNVKQNLGRTVSNVIDDAQTNVAIERRIPFQSPFWKKFIQFGICCSIVVGPWLVGNRYMVRQGVRSMYFGNALQRFRRLF